MISQYDGYYSSVEVYDSLAFLGKADGGVDVFDITDVYDPAYLFSFSNPGENVTNIEYYQDHLYLSSEYGGLYIYKITPGNAQLMASYDNSANGQTFDFCLQDSLIILPGLVDGVAILQYDSRIYFK